MQCPACNELSPDDVRFCLHCGQYLGELDDDATHVRQRVRPATTMYAAFAPPSTPQPTPERTAWTPATYILLVTCVLLVVGLAVAIAVLYKAANPSSAQQGKTISAPTPAREATVGPIHEPTPRETPRPETESITRPMPTPERRAVVNEAPIIVATPTPTPRLVVDEVVLTWSGWLADGRQMAWTVPAGIYGVDFSASGSGGTVEVVGSDNCTKTPAMIHYSHRCDLSYAGQLVITNPTTFGLGPAISVTLRVVKLRKVS